MFVSGFISLSGLPKEMLKRKTKASMPSCLPGTGGSGNWHLNWAAWAAYCLLTTLTPKKFLSRPNINPHFSSWIADPHLTGNPLLRRPTNRRRLIARQQQYENPLKKMQKDTIINVRTSKSCTTYQLLGHSDSIKMCRCKKSWKASNFNRDDKDAKLLNIRWSYWQPCNQLQVATDDMIWNQTQNCFKTTSAHLQCTYMVHLSHCRSIRVLT